MSIAKSVLLVTTATLLIVGTRTQCLLADIVIAHDVNTLGSSYAGDNEQIFAVNVANFLTANRKTKKLLLFESNPGDGSRNFSKGVLNALSNSGFEVTVTSDYSTSFANFDAIFVAQGYPNVRFLNNSDLINYVDAGGGVYLTGGVDLQADREAAGWNPFLNNYGLAFESFHNSFDNVTITSTHPIFANVTSLNCYVGQRIIDLGTNPYAQIVQTEASQGVYAVVTLTSTPSSFVYHGGWTGSGTPPWNRIDTAKTLVKEGTGPQLLTYDNLINTSQSINGIVFDIENLPDAGILSVEDFEFQMSPQGAFDVGANPPANWQAAPAPSSLTVTPGSPDRVLIQWPDQSIMNRWLRITVLANEETGLAQPETYYIGHLLGETTGPSDGVFTVSFADITPIRAEVGQTVDASSITDIDKNGTVSFADISAMRGNVGKQLTQISIP